MSKIQTDVELQVIDLSTEAFEAFCDDISGMFGVDINCSHQEDCIETIEGFKKRFRKLTAVNSVKAKGTLNGTFQLIFDQGGLFALSGVIVMLPEKRILENIKLGSISDVESMNDAVKEVGNLLVGSWDRVFRTGLKEHGHFLQTGTFIGTPWDKPKETIGLANNEEFVFASYQMTVQSFPAFQCGVIFPKNIFGSASETTSENIGTVEKKVEEDNKEKDNSGETRAAIQDDVEQNKPDMKNEQKKPDTKVDGKTNTTEVIEEKEAETGSNTEQKTADAADTPPSIREDEQTTEATAAKETKKEEEVKAETDTKAEKEESEETKKVDAETKVEKKESETVKEKASETEQETSRPPVDVPGHSDRMSLPVFAENIMEKNITWCGPDDIVQQALTKMQQHKTSYLLVGTDGTLEGIVSKSDINGAISPYIRGVFVKWRRPQDVATLQIKLKWIMSKPVRIIKQDTSVENIIETMRQFGGRCLPVVDQNGQVKGIVTVFDIFKVLENSTNTSTVKHATQAPALV